MSYGITFEKIRCVLLEDWDPIGVANTVEARDEYNSYIGSIYKILTQNPNTVELEKFLEDAEHEIGTTPDIARNQIVAAKLMSLL